MSCHRVFLILLLCATFTGTSMTVHGQDIDPLTVTFTGATALRSDSIRSRPRFFVFGWGTGAVPQHRAISDSLRINAVLTNPWYDYNDIGIRTGNSAMFAQMPDSTKLLLFNWHIEGVTPAAYSYAVSMQFDPTEGNTIADWNSFRPRTYDTSGAVFGFANRHVMGIVPADSFMVKIPQDEFEQGMKDNYNRYLLFDSDFDTYSPIGTPLLVLSQPQSPTQLINQVLLTTGIRRKQWAMLRNHNRNLAIRDAEKYGATFNWQDSVTRAGDSTVFQARGDSTEWYLALNLRRWRNDDQDAVHDTSTVVSVKVPYTYRIDTVYYRTDTNVVVNDVLGSNETVTQMMVVESIAHGSSSLTRYATFDSIATNDTLWHDPYGFMDEELTATTDTLFRIRKGMLPTPGNLPAGARPDITLSAHFWLPRLARNNRWNIVDEARNYRDTNAFASADKDQLQLLLSQARNTLPSSGFVLDTVVISVGMEIYYHGNVDVGIDYARFENRLARQILRGAKDSVIRDRTQDMYDYLDTVVTAGRGMSLYRHYFMDETPAPFWRVMRHVRRIQEQALIIENHMPLTTHHGHEAEAEERWKGWISPDLVSSAPFLRYGTLSSRNTDSSYAAMDFRTLGLGRGYRGGFNWDHADQELVLWPPSGPYDYETQINNLSGSLYSASEAEYLSKLLNEKNPAVSRHRPKACDVRSFDLERGFATVPHFAAYEIRAGTGPGHHKFAGNRF